METLRKISTNHGVILGVLLIVLTATMYAIDINLFTSSWIGGINLIVMICIGVVAALKYKKANGGFISFKEAFSGFIITIIVGYLISVAFSILLFNVIDPEAKAIITENVIKATVSMMEKFGAKAADLNKMVEEMQKSDSFGVAGQLKGFCFGIIMYSIIGLIAALIIKKDRPQSL